MCNIEDNMPLVISIVNSFHPQNHTEREDWIDAGRIGLWKAIVKFKKDKNTKLSTYAWKSVKWAIIKEIQKQRRHQTVPIVTEPSYNIDTDKLLSEYLPKTLSEQEIKIIKLRCKGYRFKEICQLLSQTPATVKYSFYKSLKKIKQCNNDS